VRACSGDSRGVSRLFLTATPGGVKWLTPRPGGFFFLRVGTRVPIGVVVCLSARIRTPDRPSRSTIAITNALSQQKVLHWTKNSLKACDVRSSGRRVLKKPRKPGVCVILCQRCCGRLLLCCLGQGRCWRRWPHTMLALLVYWPWDVTFIPWKSSSLTLRDLNPRPTCPGRTLLELVAMCNKIR